MMLRTASVRWQRVIRGGYGCSAAPRFGYLRGGGLDGSAGSACAGSEEGSGVYGSGAEGAGSFSVAGSGACLVPYCSFSDSEHLPGCNWEQSNPTLWREWRVERARRLEAAYTRQQVVWR